MNNIEAVRGLKGQWHLSNGEWFDCGHLKSLCGKGIPPNFRSKALSVSPKCQRCKNKLKKYRKKIKLNELKE